VADLKECLMNFIDYILY